MTQTEQDSARLPYMPWDALAAAVLGAALLSAGWLDVRSYLVHRHDPPPPEFALLTPTGTEQDGENGRYRRGNTFVWLENIGGLESRAQGRFRHALGPRADLFILTRSPRAQLRFRFYNPVKGQDITLGCNGRSVEQFTDLPEGFFTRQYPLALHPGANEISLDFARYNHAGADLNAKDARPMAGTFFSLDLDVD